MQDTGNHYEDVDNLFPQRPGKKDLNRWTSRVSQDSSNESHNFKCFVKTVILQDTKLLETVLLQIFLKKKLIHLMAEDSMRHYHHPKITTLLIRALLAVVSFHFGSQFTCHQLIKEGTVMSSFFRVTHLTELGNSVHAFLHQVIKLSHIILFQKFS